MKKIVYLILSATLCACSQQARMSSGEVRALDEGWKLTSEKAGVFSADVPSTVCGVLDKAGYFGDSLFIGQNYARADKDVFDGTWTYSTSFQAKPGKGQHCSLVFDGLNYYADITLNGVRIASSDTTFGVFRRREYDVTDLLKGCNKLEVSLQKAKKGDLNIGFVDWNPRPLDESMGIVRPVSLHMTGDISVEDVFVNAQPQIPSLDKADIEVRVRLKNHSSNHISGSLALSLEGEGEEALPFCIEGNSETTLKLSSDEVELFSLNNPRIWWTYDMGKPEMYRLKTTVSIGGVTSDVRNTDFGIRKIESRLTAEGYRQFTLNGRDILIKGAGWTDDLFLRNTSEDNAREVEYVKDMNLNCIRFENIWGKDDSVYDLCDRMGVLALVGWSCQWEWEDYCGLPETHGYGCINTPESEDLAVAYFHDQVVRLHNHPALIGWLTGSDRIPNPRLEARYMKVYSEEEYRPYVCSAKNLESTITGWSGTKMEGPYEYVAPDYWYRDTQAGGAFGFNTETGIGANMPQEESLRKMLPESELWPLSKGWDYHCTASGSAMNSTEMLKSVIDAQYGEAADFRDFVRKAHAVDYEGTRAMFEAFRARMPKGTGIVQWMLNSAWPSLYWQLYDWYGVPTAGYYGTKKACEPVQLIFDYKDRTVYAVSEDINERNLIANVTVYNDKSEVIGSETKDVNISYRQSSPVFNLAKYDGKPHFVALSLSTEVGQEVTDNFYCLSAQDTEYDWDKTNWYLTEIKRHPDLRFAFTQEGAQISLNVKEENDGYSITLTNDGTAISYMNILKAVNDKGELVVPAYWSDNFFALVPGQTKTVKCKTQTKETHIILN